MYLCESVSVKMCHRPWNICKWEGADESRSY